MDSGKTEPAPPTTFQKYFGRSRLYEFEVILFGFALVLGNRNYAWNQAIKYGYKLIALNIFLVGSAFVCLCFCMGEMTSALPFSGGIFGFVRAASGPYYGFIVACFETLFCLSISIVGVHACVEILEATGLIDSSLNPLVICLLYGFNLLVNLIGGKPFWTFVGLAGFITFVLVMIFILGTAIDVKTSSVSYVVNCARYDQKQPTNVVLAQRWITIFQFQGLQYLPLLSEYTQDPRKSIPRAMSICSVAFVLASFLVTLAACSTYPGQPGLKDVVAPLMYGYRHMLNTTLETGIWLHFPGILAPTMTMLYCSGRQLYMIAKSGLLPSVLTYHTPQTGTPAITLTLAAIVGALLNILSYYNDTIYTQIINIALLASHIVFINAFIAYIFFRWKYASLPRSFVNPLGRLGVFYGLGSNALGIIAVIFFNANGGVLYTLILLVCFTALATFFYWFYMVKHQTFSAEERKLMFKAYLINANRQKRGRVIKNNKVGNAPATTTNGKSLSNNGKSISANGMNQSTLVRDTANYESMTEPPCISPRQAEHTDQNSQKLHAAKSMSEKIVQFFSEKMNAISPEALHDYQQLAVLSAGGMIEPSEERQLEERLGIDDVEQSAVNE